MDWTPPEHERGTELREAASPEHWNEAGRLVLARHGLPADDLHPFDTGSDVVLGTADHVVKLTHPRWAQEMEAEWTGVSAAAGRLPVAVPEPVARGDLAGWPYVVVTRIPGTPLSTVWPGFPPEDRTRLAGDLGELVAALHRVPFPVDPGWPAFIERMRERAPAEHVSLGAEPVWGERVAAWLEVHWPPPVRQSVFLHTEVLDEHVFVTERDGRWVPAGLLDFADARHGHPGYEFPAVAEFIVKGDRAAWRAFLLGYGFAPAELTPDLSRECLTWSLVHQFGSLPRMLRAVGDPAPADLEEFAARLYPV